MNHPMNELIAATLPRTIGILGGGQLGRMLIYCSYKLGFQYVVLDPNPGAPARPLAHHFIQGSLYDSFALRQLLKHSDLCTYEIEHIDTNTLLEAEREGYSLYPSPRLLQVIQDKWVQKDVLSQAGVPVPRFFRFDGPTPGQARIPVDQGSHQAVPSGSPETVRRDDPGQPVEPSGPARVVPGEKPITGPEEPADYLGATPQEARPRGAEKPSGDPTAGWGKFLSRLANEQGIPYPLVQKSRTGGYDGRGVRILKSPSDPPMEIPSIIEEYVPFEKELAVIVARDRAGNTALYPVVEMVFNPDHNICDTVLAPARVPGEVTEEACRVARASVEALQGVGVFGVELFLTPEGKVLLNEVAPRPHNSGHYTIEACLTSQFEQHIRAITGLPLGATELIRPAVMLNLLGETGQTGIPSVLGLREALSIPGVSIHLYGKREVRPFRKMGHVTILGSTTEEVLRKAEAIRGILKVRSVRE